MKRQLEIFIDGACHGNPGEGAVGVVLLEHGKTVKEISAAIGRVTNNVAEYQALITAMKEAAQLNAQKLTINTDSELLYKQVTGQYQLKNENLKILFDEVAELSKEFQHIEIKRIPREENKVADGLAEKALKNKKAKVIAPLFKTSGEESPSSKG